jgi:hypothetical protein
MRKSLLLLIFLLTVFISPSQAARLTFTSYFPAPSGAYQKMRLNPQPTLSGSCQLYSEYPEIMPIQHRDVVQ